MKNSKGVGKILIAMLRAKEYYGSIGFFLARVFCLVFRRVETRRYKRVAPMGLGYAAGLIFRCVLDIAGCSIQRRARFKGVYPNLDGMLRAMKYYGPIDFFLARGLPLVFIAGLKPGVTIGSPRWGLVAQQA